MAEHSLASRLVKRADFLSAKASGQRYSCPFFACQWRLCAAGEADGLGLGYTASTATVGNAVKRNRARRRLKAAVHKVLKAGNPDCTTPRHVVLVAKAAVLDCSFAQLEAEMTRALTKAGVLLA